MLFETKDSVDINDLKEIKIDTFILFSAFTVYCHHNGLPLLITSIKDEVVGRKSDTHLDGRAFDVSVRAWNRKQIDDCINYFMTKYKDLGAISADTGLRRVVYLHSMADNGAEHIHVQIKKSST